MRACTSCGSTHMEPVPCGLTFTARMRSIRIDTARMDTTSRRNYYDRDAVEATFGDHALERVQDRTHGYGPGRRDPRDGRHYHQTRDGWEPMSDAEVERAYLSGPVIDET